MEDNKIYNREDYKTIRRKLRQTSTKAEKKLWNMLRAKQIRGLKFFRQYSAGSYILDFYCPAIRLAIEVDGGQHNDPKNNKAEEKRTTYLKTQDIKILRFWNNEILNNTEGVHQKITDFITPQKPYYFSFSLDGRRCSAPAERMRVNLSRPPKGGHPPQDLGRGNKVKLCPVTLRGERGDKLTKEQVLAKINEIPDPDIGISLVELGLIYDVKVAGDKIEVLMTLTTPFCPLAGTLEEQIKRKLGSKRKVKVSFTFDPPWTVDKISEATKLKLGLLT